MDVSKLDKMKVVELRAELSARGLDTKGVKAVLVDRLKTALELAPPSEGSSVSDGILQAPSTPTPATPSRRARRTRSRTRSPSPPKRLEPVLERVIEEAKPEVIHEEDEELEDLQIITPRVQKSPIKPQDNKAAHVESPKEEKVEPCAYPKYTVEDEEMETDAVDEDKAHIENKCIKILSEKSTSSDSDESSAESDVQEQSSAKIPIETKEIKTVEIKEMPTETKEKPIQIKEIESKPVESENIKIKTQDEEYTESIIQSSESQPTAYELNETQVIGAEVDEVIATVKEKASNEEDKSLTTNIDVQNRNLSTDNVKAEVEKMDEDEVETDGKREQIRRSHDDVRRRDDESRSESSQHRKLSTDDDSRASRHDEHRKRKRSFSRSRSRSKSRSQSSSRTKSRSRSRSRSRTRSRSRSPSTRRHSKRSPAPNTDDFTNEEDEPIIEEKTVALSWYDSDIHLRIDSTTFKSAKPMVDYALGLVWSGVRATHGVRSGKVAYEVRISEECTTNQFRGEKNLHGFRCGFSLPKSGLELGEDTNSFAFCESGKKCLNNEFTEYGKEFGLDDVVGCYLDLESTPAHIEFTVNGEQLGTAFEFEKSSVEEDGLFPHILTKGYEFEINFVDSENLLVNKERPKREKKIEPVQPKKDEQNGRTKKEETNIDDSAENWDDIDKPTEPIDKEDEQDKKSGDASNEDIKDSDSQSSDADNEASDKTEKKIITIAADPEPMEEDGKIKKEEENIKEIDDEKSNEDHEMAEVKPKKPASLLSDYMLIGLVDLEMVVPGLKRPESRKDCEVFLLVGLPGAGKTHWTKKHIEDHPDKRFEVIGIDALIDKMKVDGKPRKSCHVGRWEKVYDLCEKSLVILEEIATKRRRNYILDQTNVFASDQRRKMKGFGDFRRIAIVCIPSEDELKRRNDLKTEQHGNSNISESTLNRMKANFTLPSLEFGWFDEVQYTDLNDDDAKEEAKKYNEKGKKAMHSSRSSSSNYKRPRRDNYRRDERRRYDDRRRDDYHGSRWSNERRGQNNRWGGSQGGMRGGHWRDDRGYGRSTGGYDRRDNRYGGGSSGGSWISNNRQSQSRHDDRFNRQGQSASRYDYSSRDHRDRYDRDRNGGGGARRDAHRGSSQRDFRAGHRDSRTEGSRGGYESSSSKYTKDDYDYKKRSGNSTNKTSSSSSQSSWPAQHQAASWGTTANCQQQPAASYYGYDSYSAQTQQWPANSADPRQQQQWMNWWQQQQDPHASSMTATNSQYWPQYSQQAYAQPTVTQVGSHMDNNINVMQKSHSSSTKGSRSEKKS